jgi:hypothetical protein
VTIAAENPLTRPVRAIKPSRDQAREDVKTDATRGTREERPGVARAGSSRQIAAGLVVSPPLGHSVKP